MATKNPTLGTRVVFGDFSSFKNVCLYSHFDHEDVVDNYVLCALEAIKNSGFEIIFISTCAHLNQSDIDKLSYICRAVIIRENIGLDFGSWAEVINHYPELLEADSLIIANDSVYAPLENLSSYMSRMNKQGCDFWGISECYQIKPHIQSYFIHFNRKVLQSSAFRLFWSSYKHIDDKKKLIEKCEVSLTQILSQKGFSYGSAFGESNIFSSMDEIYSINPSHHLWKEMIVSYSAPCVKVELLRDNPFDIDLHEKKKIITDAGYDYDLILNHIQRVKKYYKKANMSKDVSESMSRAALKVKSRILADDVKPKIRSGYLMTSYFYKLAIIWHALKLPFTSPREAVVIYRSAFISGLKSLKNDLVASYHRRRTRSPEAFSSPTIYEYRQRRNIRFTEEILEADCFAMRQVEVKSRYAVVCHIYYKDLYREILGVIKRIPSADIFISLVEDASDDLYDTIKKDLPDCYVQVFSNHGRDVYPFVKFIQSGVLFKYDAVLKIHGKLSRNDKMSYDFDGDSWRKKIFQELVPLDGLDEMLQSYLSSSEAGMLCPDDYIYNEEHIGSNENNLSMLCATLGMEFNKEELKFPAGTMFWVKPWLLRHVDALDLNVDDFDREPSAVDGTMAHAIERFVGVITRKSGCEIVSPSALKCIDKKLGDSVDVIAFYLPQFHPIKENNIWWGEGFTEWRNVAKARPMFETHNQPRIPADLGYYDLRMDGVQKRQADIACQHGLSAFAIYHYWFSGEKMLYKPIDDFMDNDDIDFRFLLCWANENWTRSWDGLNKDILLEQRYEKGWEVNYAEDTAVYLKSSKYYTRNGRPVLLIYNVSAIPDCKKCMDNMREVFIQHGVGDVEIIAVWFYGVKYDAELYGVDGFSEFPPHRLDFIGASREILPMLKESFKGNVYNYEAMVNSKIKQIQSNCNHDMELGVMCGWDNTARRPTKADIFHGASPAIFRKWFEAAYMSSLERKTSEKKPILFINAWNEWAEGAYLEPDVKYGSGYLEAIDSVLK